MLMSLLKTSLRKKFVLLLDQPDTSDYDSSNFLFQDRTSECTLETKILNFKYEENNRKIVSCASN
jgi:hypothetical protein